MEPQWVGLIVVACILIFIWKNLSKTDIEVFSFEDSMSLDEGKKYYEEQAVAIGIEEQGKMKNTPGQDTDEFIRLTNIFHDRMNDLTKAFSAWKIKKVTNI
jgi:hypothetical protein